MRDVIVDYARAQGRDKRGGPTARPRWPTSGRSPAAAQAWTRTTCWRSTRRSAASRRLDAEAARVVELRYFAGLTLDETAEALALSTATVTRRWAMARAWLHRELEGEI